MLHLDLWTSKDKKKIWMNASSWTRGRNGHFGRLRPLTCRQRVSGFFFSPFYKTSASIHRLMCLRFINVSSIFDIVWFRCQQHPFWGKCPFGGDETCVGVGSLTTSYISTSSRGCNFVDIWQETPLINQTTITTNCAHTWDICDWMFECSGHTLN